jgi:hypothetical protein
LGRTVADERHLCHSPQERLFIEGAWAEGLLPPAEPGSATAAQYRRFAQAVAQAQRLGARAARRAFAQPAHRSAWTPELAALDGQTFSAWLAHQGLNDPHLRWYLDYCCRDDYGAGLETVSAWAGIHYFASRHGFQAPGEGAAEPSATPSSPGPKGNAWLAQRLAAPLQGRLHTGRTVLRVEEQRQGVRLLAWDEGAQRAELWAANTVVLAVPLFIAARVLANPPDALSQAATLLQYAPWLVANVHIDAPLVDRPGAPPSWDNVVYGQRGLGYVDASHQSLRPLRRRHGADGLSRTDPCRTPAAAGRRPRALARAGAAGLARCAPRHPPTCAARGPDALGPCDGHTAPGVQRHPALAALRAARGRVRFAHADLAGCSVFEEAFARAAKWRVARQALKPARCQ